MSVTRVAPMGDIAEAGVDRGILTVSFPWIGYYGGGRDRSR